MKCLNDCGNELNNNAKFCSMKCSGQYVSKSKISDWLDGSWDGTVKSGLSITIRSYLIEEAEHKCTECGWCTVNPDLGYPPLEINHIDGNFMNNCRENLEVLCPNCHSVRPNYKALNKVGRGHRSKYSQYNLVDDKDRLNTKSGDTTRSTTPSNYLQETCSCGDKMTKGSVNCIECYRSSQKSSRYPDKNTLIDLIESNGYVKAGNILGVSDNSIRKHLRSIGVTELPVKRNSLPTCYCGSQVKDYGYTKCAEHTPKVNRIDWPDSNTLYEMYKEHGPSAVARSLGVKSPVTVSRYLKRKGFDLT